jgi:hypothetical protein
MTDQEIEQIAKETGVSPEQVLLYLYYRTQGWSSHVCGRRSGIGIHIKYREFLKHEKIYAINKKYEEKSIGYYTKIISSNLHPVAGLPPYTKRRPNGFSRDSGEKT